MVEYPFMPCFPLLIVFELCALTVRRSACIFSRCSFKYTGTDTFNETDTCTRMVRMSMLIFFSSNAVWTCSLVEMLVFTCKSTRRCYSEDHRFVNLGSHTTVRIFLISFRFVCGVFWTLPFLLISTINLERRAGGRCLVMVIQELRYCSIHRPSLHLRSNIHSISHLKLMSHSPAVHGQ